MGLRIVMLGAPGAGKGTQAKRIAEACGLPHISTGDIFRAHLRDGTPLGRQVRQYLDAGTLVPDALTCEIVAERIREDDCARGYILDGFPRSAPQADTFHELLAGRGEKLDLALNIDVDDGEIVERLTARRSCPKCGAIYNLKFQPPRQDGVCDHDGEPLVQRRDDTEETVKERLRVYHETTEPIVAYYQTEGILKTVSGTGATPAAVFSKIEAILASRELG